METTELEALFTRPFTRQQACDAGLSRKRLITMVKDRSLHRIFHGVYGHRSLPDTFDTRLAALQLVMGAHVVVCGRTASWLWGVDAFSYSELELLPPVETCVLSTQNRLRRTRCKGSRRDLDLQDVVRLEGLLVTSPLRTALDLGCGLRRRDALATLDWFLRLEYFNQAALSNDLRRFTRRRGVIQLRELVSLADGRAESPGESWTRLSMIDAGLPVPQLQWPVVREGRERFRLDHAYPHHLVCVEYDGEQFHTSEDDRSHDEARRAWLRAHGWIVIVVRKEDFAFDAVSRWTGEVRAALASRHG